MERSKNNSKRLRRTTEREGASADPTKKKKGFKSRPKAKECAAGST